MPFFNRRNKKPGKPTHSGFPRHIAIIMDGNGRWATERGLPRTAGHSAGAEVFRKIAFHCRDIGLDFLTVYAFSTENWKRSQDEVAAIMRLLEKYLLEAIEKMRKDGIRLNIVGGISALPESIQKLSRETQEISKDIDGFQVNMCVNYGGRNEIIQAAMRYAQDSRGVGELSEKQFSDYLYTAGIPDPDLIIRPSGELRISNFLLWQSAYSELYFTDTLWPDFTTIDIDNAIADYLKRNRRYGKA